MPLIHNSLEATWLMLVESAPWLLLGFLIAGLLRSFVSPSFIIKHLSRPGSVSVLKASAVGIPLPLCSCSVIPVGLALRKQGASRGAMASFFISTPEVGVDSFLLSYGLLGPFVAILRLMAAAISAASVGLFLDMMSWGDKGAIQDRQGESSCCTKAALKSGSIVSISSHSVYWSKIKSTLRFGFVNAVDDVSIVLVFGFLLAGVVAANVPDDYFVSSGYSSWIIILLMLILSVPLYVCATAATPLAAVLIAKGVSPGAAFVFLLAGPATNITTIFALYRELGAKGTAVYVSGIALVALAFGVLIDYSGMQIIAEVQGVVKQTLLHHQHQSEVHLIAGALLTGLLFASLVRKVVNPKP